MPARAQLLDTASHLFYTDGIGATGVDAVVRAAGVSKPTLYAHFGSKADLVAAVLSARHERRAEELEAWVRREPDPRRRPLAVFGYLKRFYAHEGARGCAFLNAAAELRHDDDAARRAIVAEKAWLLGLLARLCEEAGVREPERVASQLLLLVDGIGGRVVVHGPAAAPGAIADAEAAAARLLA